MAERITAAEGGRRYIVQCVKTTATALSGPPTLRRSSSAARSATPLAGHALEVGEVLEADDVRRPMTSAPALQDAVLTEVAAGGHARAAGYCAENRAVKDPIFVRSAAARAIAFETAACAAALHYEDAIRQR